MRNAHRADRIVFSAIVGMARPLPRRICAFSNPHFCSEKYCGNFGGTLSNLPATDVYCPRMCLTLKTELIDATTVCIRAKQHLVRRRRDANWPGRARYHRLWSFDR